MPFLCPLPGAPCAACRSAMRECVQSGTHTALRKSAAKSKPGSRGRCRAGQQSPPTEPSTSQQDSSRNDKANPEKLKLQKVERLGEESWAGVAAVDREEDSPSTSVGKAVLLASGDLTALLLFTAIGRSNHGESLDVVSVLKTAAPFLIGWFGAADLQKAFGSEAQGGSVGAAAKKAAVVWATGIPVGILVRTAQRGYLPDTSFVIVTMVVTAIFLVGWRSVLAVATPAQSTQEAGKGAASRRRNRKGNPFEFLQLLTSLTKRW